jgi:RND family efflux transporter MFP subunit
LLALLQPTFSEQTSRLLEAEANFLRATATYEQSKLVLERTKRLAAEQAKSPRELQEAEFAFASAEANYKAAVALSSTYKNMTSGKDQTNGLTDFSFVELRAPRAGIIGSLGQRLGELIQPDQVLFTVFDPKQIWIEAKLPENKLKHIPGQPQAFLQEGSKLVPLTFVYAGITIDPLTRSIPVTYSISDTNAPLRLGQTVRMDVVTRRVEKGIAIPESAIVEEEGNPVVFVQVAGETFEKRELVLGVRGGGWVQVLQGLQPGERLVTKGAYAIRLASVSNAIPSHGHAH